MDDTRTPYRTGYWRYVAPVAAFVLMFAAAFAVAPHAGASTLTTPRARSYHEQLNNWGTPIVPVMATSGCTMNSSAVGPANDGNTAFDGQIFLGTGSSCGGTTNTTFWEQTGPMPDETPLFDAYGSSPTFTIPSTSDVTDQPANWGGWMPGSGTGQPPTNPATGAAMPYYGVPNGNISTATQQQDPTSLGATGSCSSLVSGAGLGYPTPVPTPSGGGTYGAGVTATSGPAVNGVCFDGSSPTAAGVWDMATSLSTDVFYWPWNTASGGPACSSTAAQCLQNLEYDMSWAMHNFGSGATPGTDIYGLPVLQPLPYQLPSNFLSLTYNQQMFVAIDTWLIDYGQYPFVAMSNTLNAAALSAAQASTDPTFTPWPGNSAYDAMGYKTSNGMSISNPNSPWVTGVGYAGGVDYNMGGVWVGDNSDPVGELMEFIYEDGWDTQTNMSPNVDCTSATASACWGHLRNLEEPTLPQAQSVTAPSSMDYTNAVMGQPAPPQTCATMFCVMGVGSTSSANGKLPNGDTWTGPSTSVLMEDWPGPTNASDISFTFAQEIPYLPADEQAVAQHMLWWANPQLSVGGAQALIAGSGSTTSGTSSGTSGTSSGTSGTSSGTSGTSSGTSGTSTPGV